MSLTTHIGGKQSESFVSVAEADVLIQLLPDPPDTWDDLEQEEKEYRLILAASAMGTMAWRGRRAYDGQALCFPRTFQGNPHSIPDEVKMVQTFVAYSVIHRALANRPTSVSEAVTGTRVTKVSLGGLLAVSFSGTAVEAGSGLEKIVRAAAFPAYLRCLRYLSQARGGTITDAKITGSTTTTTTTTTTTV